MEHIITAIMEATTMIRRHLPLITGRLVFTSQVLPTVPIVTPRMDFDMEDLPSEGNQASERDDERDNERDDSLSELSAIDSDGSSEFEDLGNGKIPKPAGEAGRPHSGGYNLKEALGWPKADFEKIQVILQESSEKTRLSPYGRNMSGPKHGTNQTQTEALLIKKAV